MTTPRSSRIGFASLVRLLYTQNPFYLIGTFLILFGLQQSLGNRVGLATSGLLVGLLAAYTLLLAGVATLIIRWGKVWDDARTILLVIVLLFFMLSTSLDVHILYAPLPGTALLAGGLLFSVVISESVLRASRMHLAAAYRGPYYLMLTLLFGYPVALAWISRLDHYLLLSWALFAFPAFASIVLLTLLPAARTRRRHEPPSGTPWPWPYFPWSLFVYLTIGVSIRAWWLTIAFEPAEGQDTAFRLYYLAPLLLPWSAIFIEIGKARASRAALSAGMALPLVALGVAFPGRPTNAVEHQFVMQLAEAIGSPPQVVIGSLLLFYAWAWLRGIRSAEALVLALLGLASLVARTTLDTSTLVAPQLPVVAALVAALLVQAWRRQSTWRAAAAVLMVALGMRLNFPAASDSQWFWQCHGPLLVCLWLTALFNDHLAQQWRQLAWRVTPCLAAVAATLYPWAIPGASQHTIASYAALLLLTSVVLWYRQRQTGPLAAAALTFSANLAAHVPPLYVWLGDSLLAEGLPFLAAGLGAVLLAFGISLLKMGLWRRAWDWLQFVNRSLGGAGEQTG